MPRPTVILLLAVTCSLTLFCVRAQADAASAQGLVTEGNALWEAGDLSAAEAKYREASVADTASLDARLKLGGLLMAQQRLDEAIEQFQAATGLDPQNPKLFTVLGVAYMHRGDYRLAYAASGEALQLDPDLQSALELRALAERKLAMGAPTTPNTAHPSGIAHPPMGFAHPPVDDVAPMAGRRQ